MIQKTKIQTLPMSTNVIVSQLEALAQEERKSVFISFFKTAKGEYGEGDQFLGVSVPNSRIVAKQNVHASYDTIKSLLYHPVHECRLCAGLIMVEQFKRAKKKPEVKEEL